MFGKKNENEEIEMVYKDELGMKIPIKKPEVTTRHSPEEEERMHEEELRRRLEGMDERDWKVVAQCIPVDLLVDRLRSELTEKMEWKIKIDEMYHRFHNI